jgi:hypothetical protein
MCGGSACVARKHDGTAVAWGSLPFGGDASNVDLTNIGDGEAQATTETMSTSIRATATTETVSTSIRAAATTETMLSTTWTTTITETISSSTTTAGVSPVTIFFLVGGIGAALTL